MPCLLVNESKIFPNFGSVSKWVAAGGKDDASHVKMQFQRVDSSSTSIVTASGNTKLQSITTNPSTLTIGGKVHATLYSAGSVILAQGTYTILAYTGTDLTINCPFNASFSFARFNFTTDYQNHYFKAYHKVGGETIATTIHREGPDATFWLNISPFIKGSLDMTVKEIPASGNNDVADGCDVELEIEIYNVYTGPDGFVDDVASGGNFFLNVVNAANQLKNPKGISLVDKIADNTPNQTLKFLSDFEQPVWFAGFPFHLTFIYSEYMTSPISVTIVCLDINGTSLSTTTNALTDHKGHVNRLFLRGSIHADTDTIQVKLVKTTGGTVMSETKTVRYVHCAGRVPVCIKWMGQSGAWNHYVFASNQLESLATATPEGVFKQFITDLATAHTDSSFLSVDSVPELSLGASGIPSNDIDGLKSMLSSAKGMMLTNPDDWTTDGDEYTGVKVKPGRFSLRKTKSTTGDIDLTISLPEIYSQTL